MITIVTNDYYIITAQPGCYRVQIRWYVLQQRSLQCELEVNCRIQGTCYHFGTMWTPALE